MVLKRKDYEEAFEENTWRLLSEVSLSEERFQEVNALIFEVIACVDNVSKATFLISISNEMKLILLNFAKFWGEKWDGNQIGEGEKDNNLKYIYILFY